MGGIGLSLTLIFSHAMQKLIVILTCVGLLAGCNSAATQTRDTLTEQLESSAETITLADIGPSDWERFCVLAPYLTHESAIAQLGFDWDAESETSIERRDDVYIVVFADQENVISHVEMPRQSRELINSSISCLERSNSTIAWSVDDGWEVVENQNNGE